MPDQPLKPAQPAQPVDKKAAAQTQHESSAGEEDPGASLGDPVLRDAMQGEAAHGSKPARKARRQADAALDNVREGYGGDPDAAGKGR